MPTAKVVIEADGGSRGNPGPAGYGAVVRDAATGAVLAERAAAIGVATNNVAEYQGLIAGLRAAAEVAPGAELEVRMDSKLVIEQMTGRWQVKHPAMRPLNAEAASLVATWPAPVRYSWVPRERNKHADRLANEAMDAAAKGRAWNAPEDRPARPAPGAREPAGAGGRRAAAWGAQRTATWTVLLRHGQTAASVAKRFSGTCDAELTDTGRAQAAAAAARLRGQVFDAVISSPLSRARETALAALPGLVGPDGGQPAFLVDDGLRETDFGVFEGLTFAEARERFPDELTAWLASPDVAPPGGESLTATIDRVRVSLEQHRADFPGARLLLVAHMGPIKSAASLALGAGAAVFYRLHLDLASLTTIAWYADGPAVIHGFNDASHLPADAGM